jgi:putative colanic acid biosynthesis acetyltransferase WcaF
MTRALLQRHSGHELSLKRRSKRALWNCVWLLLYRPSPRPFFAWRCMLLRLFGAKVGRRAHPYPSARIWAPWNLVMRDDACIADGVDCYNVDTITIGRFAIVSQRAFLCSASHDFRDPAFPLTTGAILVEDHAWVAAEAFVGPGVSIEEGAVVAARAVVTKDVTAWTIVAGSPARTIGSRPTPARRI